MSSNFKLSLYLSTKYSYVFNYPVDSNKQNNNLRQELGLTDEEFIDWRPNWKSLPLYNRINFIDALSNNFSFVTEEHVCREIAMSKGAFYDQWQSAMGVVYQQSYLTLTYPEPIPQPFKDVVTSALLVPYSANTYRSQSIQCNLEDTKFGIGMYPAYWDKAWVSLLTYFAKYGEFLWEISGIGMDKQATLDQTIRAILDSWSGQVGFYTAYGLWLWENRFETAIRDPHKQFNGIHEAMNHFAALYEPNSLLRFIKQYSLDLGRVSRLFLNNHRERCEVAGLEIPSWYASGKGNDNYLAESPEWRNYMGLDDDGDDDDDDFYFEEEEW